jgi:inner membrane protein
MLFRTHLVFSVAVYFLLLYFLAVPNPLFLLLFILLATLFVDIDSCQSKIGHRWYLRPIQWLTTHRGIVHSLFFGLILSLLIAGLNNWAGFGFFVGYLSHLFLDFLTRSGVAFLWPLSSKKFGLWIKSGGVIEEIIFVLFLLGDVVWMFRIFLN